MSGPIRQPVTRLKLEGAEGAPSILANAYTQQARQSQPSSSRSEEPKASLFVKLRSLINPNAKLHAAADPTPDETYKKLALSFGNEAIQPPSLSEDEHASHDSTDEVNPNTPRS